MDQMREIHIADLNTRQIYRDDQWFSPGRRFAASRPKHPLSDLRNDTALLRNRNEFDRRNISSRGMIPAQQSLEADDPAVGDVFLRLVDEMQLSPGDGIAEVVLQKAAIPHGGAHRSFEESIGPTSFILGAVERGIGMGEKRLPLRRVVRTYGNPDARGDRGVGFRVIARGLENLKDVLGDAP